ncbi:DUF4040 family protein [Corynebacterium felinum]|uniref:Multicomponent Na+:H+ antiporter subunit A n=1 Tax=Corynebacterium felinum TaxID=131318 RepID=A0ABU2B7X1_9CORY|nr:DUF4040 family protein [Corynebacterium felinum]MDF5821160.1 DUF4040 family protein [Corynebacterium felinum]MDR7354486.1 multicomponent Na+:H+ antiporter subunit A [Corynebacterium felinum]WJY93855.1 Na(+)/H(+) antiporter subunit A [Corynebacterium felinum]
MSLIIVPALAALGVAAAPVLVRIFDRNAGWPLAGLFIVAAVLLMQQLPGILSGQPLTFTYTWVPDVLGEGIDAHVAMRADALSVFFALLALVVGSVVFIYSASYLPKLKGNTSFYTIMTAFMASILLLVFANDAVVLFVAWELVSLASFMLIARSGGKGGEQGSQRTLVLTFIGGLTLLVALAIASTQAGTTSIDGILASDFWSQSPALTSVIAILIAVSAFTKSAQLPFHFWLPEAMAAATPVSAFLHAAAVVKAGIYLLLRFSQVFHDVWVWNVVLIVVGMSTAVMASLFAIQKTDLKKLTAYSTVSHLGWIVATIGVGTPFALAAALVHTLAHALFKSSLFMLIGVVDHQTGTRDSARLGSCWRKLPFTFGSVVIAAGSMAALPPTLGFISKEGMLGAFEQAPLSSVAVWVLLAAASVGAFFTFTYSARIVFDGFVDGDRDMSEVREAPVKLWLPAALPGLLSLPLVAVVSLFDAPISAAVAAISSDPHTHLALWHGVNVPLLISLGVTIAGCVGIYYRKLLWSFVDGRAFAPYTGNHLLMRFNQSFSHVGKKLAKMADSLAPARHLAYLFGLLLLLGVSVIVSAWKSGDLFSIDGVPIQPRNPGADFVVDLVPLIIIALGVVFLLRTSTRMTAVLFIGAVGVGVTLQMLVLGAPDVALTQFLVEALVVVIMMMVVRQQPDTFHPTKQKRRIAGAILGVCVGVITFLVSFMMLGRHPRSEIGQWYLQQAPDITGGDNVVNTILVEFRAFDTLGELSVLGMAAIVIAAVVTSMPRYPFHPGTHPAPFGQSTVNAIPLKSLLKVLIPILLVLSALIFWRGHNEPGGGFIAALVAGCAMMLSYLSFPRDRRIFPVSTPIYLTGIGVITAVGAGFLGLLKGSFLYAIHGYFAGQHLTTAIIFDVGVYLAVLGMLSMAINALGGYLRPGMEYQDLNFTREDSPLWQPKKVPDSFDELHRLDSPAAKEIRAAAIRESDALKADDAAHAATISGSVPVEGEAKQ